MAKKRSKKVSRKKPKSKKPMEKTKRVRKVKRKTISATIPTKKKFNLVLKNLIIFAVISLASFVLYTVSNSLMFRNLFSLLSMIFGFVAVAFLIILFIFIFMKTIKKK